MSSHTAHSVARHATTAADPPIVENRFGIERQIIASRNTVLRVGLFTAAALLLWIGSSLDSFLSVVASLILLLVGFGVPTRARLQRRADLEHDEAIAKELERRLAEFKASFDSATGNPHALRQMNAARERLALTEREIGYSTVERCEAAADLLEFVAAAAARGGLSPVSGHERVVGDAICYFAAHNVLYDKQSADDPTGTLLLTDAGVTFIAPEGLASVPWSKTASVRSRGRRLFVQRRDRKTPHEFAFDAYREAAIGVYVAETLWANSVDRAGCV